MTDPGKLFVCATPIGNLEDASPRLLRILKEADVIAAEDTRHTAKLLLHFGITTPLTSYHKFSGRGKEDSIVSRILNGQNVALVSDAGMPGISDPGAALVKNAIAEGITISVIPGPSAIISALAVSGMNTDRFVFEGFLPREGKMRRRLLRELAEEKRTMVFYESPHRLLKALKDILAIFGDRDICVAREMTKIYEEFFRGKVSAAIESFSSREILGEITICCDPAVPITSWKRQGVNR